MQPRPEVLIVGAGPVGLTAAVALSHHGVRCRIIDKVAEPTDKSKALVVWSRTLELLSKFGLAETFLQCGMKIHGASIYGDGKRIVHIETDGVESPFPGPLMIPQNETERLLALHLQQRGIVVERQLELTSFQEMPAEVNCTLRHADGSEEACSVDWLVGCDGAHSTVRHQLGLEFTGHAEMNDWILADVSIEGGLSTEELSIYWHSKGILAFFPITQTRFRMIADLGPVKVAGRPADPTLAEAQAKVDERGPGGLTLTHPNWLAAFRINERKVADYRRGRVILAGDAAHIHSPAGGQGMNTGMQDALNFAWKLALIQRGVGQPEVLLQSYSTERSAVGDQVLNGAEVMTTVATLRNPVAQFMRNHTASVMSSFGFVQDKIRNMLCELSINYRHSLLSQSDWPHGVGGLPAGDRLPDAPLTATTDGHQTTVFNVMDGLKHTLLLFADDKSFGPTEQTLAAIEQVQSDYPGLISVQLILPAGSSSILENALTDQTPVQAWCDTAGRLHKLLGIRRQALILVRPDGYIGYRSQPAEVSAFRKYLETYLVAPAAAASR